MFGKVIMSQEGDSKGNVGTGSCQVPVLQCLVDTVQSPCATGFFEVGGHGVGFGAGESAFAIVVNGVCWMGKRKEG